MSTMHENAEPDNQIASTFYSAVNVIKGLPKNGSYQPSQDMMLRFYSYYKQATLGPCTQKKPAFWDVINKTKWDSWHRLGTMSQEDAMSNYVNELKKIIETMSYTDNVAQFMGSFDELNGVNFDDLEVVAPEVMKKARSHPNSPFASREASPIRPNFAGDLSVPKENGINGSDGSTYTNGHSETNGNGNGYTNGHITEHSDDEYIDTVDDETAFKVPTSQHKSRSKNRHNQTNGFPRTDYSVSGTDPVMIEVLTKLNQTVEKMNMDLNQITSRINLVERTFIEFRNSTARKEIIVKKKYPEWWPLDDISPNWFFFMVVWPFIAMKLTQVMQKRK